MVLLPLHAHPHPGCARGVIEEQHFLDRAGLDLAVFAELHRDRGEAVGLLRHVEPEGIGLAFIDPDQRVGERRGQERKDRDQDAQHRQRGGITKVADAAPPGAVTRNQRRSDARDQEHRQRRQRTEEGQTPPHVVQDIVPHLMPHHSCDFLRGAAIKQVVVEADADGRADPRDVGRNPLGLLRGVEQVDMFRGNVLGLRHRDDPVADRPGGQLGICVEQRRDEDRSDQHGECQERGDHPGGHDPPVFGEAPDHGVNRHRQQRHDHQVDPEPLGQIEQPASKALVHQIVLLLAHETGVDRPRQGQYGASNRVAQHGDPGDPGRAFEQPLAQITELHRQAEPQQQSVDQHRNQRAPRDQPVAALKIGVGLGAGRALQRIEPGPGRGLDIEAASLGSSMCRPWQHDHSQGSEWQ